MAVKIRLARAGTTNSPFYHVVACDSRAPRDGKFLEKLGYYNPLVTKEKETEKNKKLAIDLERAKYWLSVGAEASETVAKILVAQGLDGAKKFIKPHVKGEFYGISKDERKKILQKREDDAKKLAAEKKKQKLEAEKAAAAAAAAGN